MEIVTHSVLLDIANRLEVSDEDHRDLELDTKHNRGGLTADLAISVGQFGELVTLNNASLVPRLLAAHAVLERERRPWLKFLGTSATRVERNPLDSPAPLRASPPR